MKRIEATLEEISGRATQFKNWRDEIISKLTDGINKERIGTKWPQLTKAQIAKMVNKNIFLSKKSKDDELALLLKECEQRGNYKKFWWVISQKKKV